MIPQERKEIESACSSLEDDLDVGHLSWMSHTEVETLLKFARQQLNLRVDGQKLMESIIGSCLSSPQCVESDDHSIVTVWSSGAAEQLEALVMECLTTEEKE